MKIHLALSSAVATTLLLATAFSAELTLSTKDRQAIQGWGFFPSNSHSNWGTVHKSIANRKAIRDKVFELPVNYVRLELSSNSYDGKAEGKLNLGAMEQLKVHLGMARDYGVTKWLISVWSPPALFKSPHQSTKGKVDGVETYLNMEHMQDFCEYYGNALVWLKENGCGTPVMISIQNEPNYPVDYDGSGFKTADDYKNTVRQMRKTLDAKGLKEVRIGGCESGQPGDPRFLGSGSNHYADVDSVPIDDAIAHTYGGAGWDHLQFSKASRPKWMTEWCDISGHDEITVAVDSAAHIARDILNDGAENWFWWNAYAAHDKVSSKDLVYGMDVENPKTTRTFHILKRLFSEVKPDGSFKVRGFSSDDASINTGFGKDYSKPVNIMAFVSAEKTIIMIANPSKEEKEITLKDIPVEKLHRFQTTAETDSAKAMDDLGEIAIKDGTSEGFKLKPASVQILTSDAVKF